MSSSFCKLILWVVERGGAFGVVSIWLDEIALTWMGTVASLAVPVIFLADLGEEGFSF